jgi:histidinol-phosphate/aromatic aminotransferase/cobyric acid decarboxylase-like protein
MSLAPAAGAHGGDGAVLAATLGIDPSDVLDLSASMNPVAPDPAPVVGRHLDAVARYPDPASATAALAEAMGVDPAHMLLTNGGAEGIALTAAECGGFAIEPEFGLYRRYLGDGGSTGGRWRSNPHNPSGLLAAAHETAAVWDEAFWPLATGTWTRGDAGAGAVVLGSLTKLLACPGLRAGYVVAEDTGLVDRLRRRQPQWSVNGLVCEALPDLLATVDLRAWARATVSLRDDLACLLTAHGFTPRPSAANWLLVDAPDLRERLARHAILVRDCTSFGMPGTVRIAVPTEAGLARVERALTAA